MDVHSVSKCDILTDLLHILPNSWIGYSSSVVVKQMRHILVNSFTTSGNWTVFIMQNNDPLKKHCLFNRQNQKLTTNNNYSQFVLALKQCQFKIVSNEIHNMRWHLLMMHNEAFLPRKWQLRVGLKFHNSFKKCIQFTQFFSDEWNSKENKNEMKIDFKKWIFLHTMTKLRNFLF